MLDLLNKSFVQNSGNIVSNMNGEKVMLNVNRGKYFNLGKTGGEIWELLKEPTTVKQLVAILTTEYEIDEEECAEQITSFLEVLLKEELIHPVAAANLL